MAGTRNIFEDVSDAQAQERKAPVGGMIDKGGAGGARRGIRLWLVVLFALVAVMIVVGGLFTTGENLATNLLPPMSEADWASAFAPHEPSGMDLAAFKQAYWLEWGHRSLGLVTGLVWLAGFLGFWAAGNIPTGWMRRLLVIGVLLGAQGGVGWWMGASVSLLALHLGLAFVVSGLIAWAAMQLSHSEAALMQARRLRERRLFGLATGLMLIAFLQVLLSALVMRIDPGHLFTDWPWMGGQFFPPDAFLIEPVWRNFLENPGLVQFMHRMAGYLLALVGLAAVIRSRQAAATSTRSAFALAGLVLLAQVALGIATVLQAAPLRMAIAHQAGALLLWVLILHARFRAGYPEQQKIRG